MVELSHETLIILIALFFTAVILGFLFFLIFKNSINSLSTSMNNKMNEDREKLNSFVFELQRKYQTEQFEVQSDLKDSIFSNFSGLKDKINKDLNSSMDKSQETFQKVMQRLVKIDEAQRRIDGLSDSVMSLNSILNDKKTRGIFGEVQLAHVLYQIFGDANFYYSLQHKMPNSTIVDCLLLLPEPLGKLAVDSKFPLENYRNLIEAREKGVEGKTTETLFRRSIKKHIDDISSKYIIGNYTGEHALMFIPAEAIYLEIHSHFLDLVDYAQRKNVWLSSPTTMMAILSTVQVVIKEQKQAENIHLIQKELKSLSIDFRLWRDRWDKLSRSFETIKKVSGEIEISSKKIEKKFYKITNQEANNLTGDDSLA